MNVDESAFETSHYAATFAQKVRRSLELGPKYYGWDLPRYLFHRRSLGLPVCDVDVFWNPFREFRPRSYESRELPPGYEAALSQFRDLGIRLSMPRARLEGLLGVWWATRDVAGDVIECGAYRGATSLLIALLGSVNGVAQKTFVLDTFHGMPAPSAFDGSRTRGEFLPAENQVALLEQQAKALAIRDRIEIHAGYFADIFKVLSVRIPHFTFVHIDANIYQSTLEACEFCLPRLLPGGAVVFDDYNGVCDLGARLAIDQWLHAHPTSWATPPKALAACSAYLQK